MVDAGAALSAVASGVAAKITVVSAALPTVVLRSDSVAIVDDQIVGISWALIGGGGIATRLEGSTTDATASISPSGVGTLRVRLTVTGNLGGQSSTDQIVEVSAAAPPPTSSGGGGGGGAASGAWVAGVGLAAAVLWLLRRRPRDLRAASGP